MVSTPDFTPQAAALDAFAGAAERTADEFAAYVAALRCTGLDGEALARVVRAGEGHPLAAAYAEGAERGQVLAAGLRAELAGLDEAMGRLGASMTDVLRRERDSWT